MSDYAAVQTAVTGYVRQYVASLRRLGWTYERIGEHLGSSHVWVLQLDQPAKYGNRLVGADLEHKLAELLHGGSIDALRRAALHLAAGGAVTNEGESGAPVDMGASEVDRGGRRRRPRSK